MSYQFTKKDKKKKKTETVSSVLKATDLYLSSQSVAKLYVTCFIQDNLISEN